MSEDEQWAALHQKLEDLVHEYSTLTEGSDGCIPVSWGLIVGYEAPQADGTSAGATSWLPRDGGQATWKSIGMLQTILNRMVTDS
ncbi:hypothetical protein HOT94_gp098 [Gordonia phage Phistory]|uniref:Uncharacterized protein n=1 Tax=Gordonia phage Phistory TaxID=2301694 RepID=A0A385DZ43_9CAUD|nr:hypothetical protein HOT94_gp098 [Gordonia phage Phistory]AXQ64803.1 hypothetical protein SEA_PHISTORY_98 [Gordonia phage Phistory]